MFSGMHIMMLAVNIQLFTASLQRLQMSQNKAHEWSNSVGKKFFQRLLEAVAPHYNLWVSFSTGGDFHQPGSSHLYIQEVGAITRSRRSSSSSSTSQQTEYLQPIPVRFGSLKPPIPLYFIHLSMNTWIKLKLSVPDLILYDAKGRVVFVFELKCTMTNLQLSSS